MIDVIVAAHDRPGWLDECLDSIHVAARRVKPKVGVIVVDDASAVGPMIERVARRHGARYIRHETNTGVAQTLADGWAASKAPWTSFWGDDDVMLPNWFERHLEHTDADVISSSYNLVGPDLAYWQTYVLAPVTLTDLLDNRVSANDGSLLRRSAVPRLRPERERAMMLTLWLEMARAGARFATIPEPCWLYRRHSQNLSGQLPLQAEPRFAALRAEAIAEYA